MNINFTLKNIAKKVDNFDFSSFTEEECKKKVEELKLRINSGEKLEKVMPEMFALVRHASEKTLGLKHFNVQLLGGLVLNKGCIAEMSTGAGKTLTATLPLCLNALTGRGVHLITVNDYLAQRDAEWMGPIYDYLGFTYGSITHDTEPEERKDIYTRDIVYVTNSEFGFDYLRDNMVLDKEDRVMSKDFFFCIIDEADSILIDESRTPLIISASGKESSDIYKACDFFAKSLKKDDVEKDEESKTWMLTESGVKKAEKTFSLKNFSDVENAVLRHHITQAIKANYDMKLDKEYIVKDGEIVIIDEHTGRQSPGRRYSDGLHQALEAKEHVEVKSESITLASITYQNFFKQYEKISGMTGTAMTEKREFKEIYGLNVVRIPDNSPCIRKDNRDLVYVSEEAKLDAMINDIKETHSKNRPILIGTLDIEKSEELSKRLNKEGLKHNLLNAKQDAMEADIVSHAGEAGAITIATNMAGRGTDIKLGPGVKELGGLKIIASERAVDRRIDNQLIGRCGRQGDPGESQFYLSMDDELLEYVTGTNHDRIVALNKDDPDPINNKAFTSLIYSCQKKIENRHFEERKNTTKYDTILNNQRINVYNQRDYLLENDSKEIVKNMANVVFEKEFNNENFTKIFKIKEPDIQSALHIVNSRIEDYSKEGSLSVLILRIVDIYWARHIDKMNVLKQDTRGAAYRNEDPVQVFNKQATKLFEEMNYNIKHDVILNILNTK